MRLCYEQELINTESEHQNCDSCILILALTRRKKDKNLTSSQDTNPCLMRAIHSSIIWDWQMWQCFLHYWSSWDKASLKRQPPRVQPPWIPRVSWRQSFGSWFGQGPAQNRVGWPKNTPRVASLAPKLRSGQLRAKKLELPFSYTQLSTEASCRRPGPDCCSSLKSGEKWPFLSKFLLTSHPPTHRGGCEIAPLPRVLLQAGLSPVENGRA